MKSPCGILWKGVLEPLTHVCTDLKISKESNVLIQVIVMWEGSSFFSESLSTRRLTIFSKRENYLFWRLKWANVKLYNLPTLVWDCRCAMLIQKKSNDKRISSKHKCIENDVVKVWVAWGWIAFFWDSTDSSYSQIDKRNAKGWQH